MQKRLNRSICHLGAWIREELFHLHVCVCVCVCVCGGLDIDECLEDNACNCLANQICINTFNSCICISSVAGASQSHSPSSLYSTFMSRSHSHVLYRRLVGGPHWFNGLVNKKVMDSTPGQSAVAILVSFKTIRYWSTLTTWASYSHSGTKQYNLVPVGGGAVMSCGWEGNHRSDVTLVFGLKHHVLAGSEPK